MSARTVSIAVLLCTCAAAPFAQDVAQEKDKPAAARPDAGFQGKLYRSVFSAGAGVLTAADVEQTAEPMKARLTTYLSRRTAFRSSYKHASDSLEVIRTDAKKRAIERAIVALIDVRGIERLAADFVVQAPIAYEWHGVHDGPLAEAAFAENVALKNPDSPLAPFLYVFIAHRQRVVFETYEAAKNADGMKTAARKYRAFAERARAVEDPIFGALMADIDGLPNVYLKSTAHPRDYDAKTP